MQTITPCHTGLPSWGATPSRVGVVWVDRDAVCEVSFDRKTKADTDRVLHEFWIAVLAFVRDCSMEDRLFVSYSEILDAVGVPAQHHDSARKRLWTMHRNGLLRCHGRGTGSRWRMTRTGLEYLWQHEDGGVFV